MESITVTAPASVPAGTYEATFTGLERKTSREGVEFWVWGFTLATGEEVSGASSMKTGPKSKAYKWLTGLLGRKPQPNETLGANLVGRRCLLVLSQDEQGYNDVDDVLPPAVAPVAELPAPPVEETPPPPDEPPADVDLLDLPF